MAWDDMGTMFVETNTGEPPEEIQYFPSASNGIALSRTISAIVERQPRETMPGAQRGGSMPITITVKNDSLEGISSQELNLRGDAVELFDRLGDVTPTRHTILTVRHDSALLILELR